MKWNATRDKWIRSPSGTGSQSPSGSSIDTDTDPEQTPWLRLVLFGDPRTGRLTIWVIGVLLVAVWVLAAGCENQRIAEDAVLARVADRVATQADFFQAMEMTAIAYERDRLDDPDVHRHLCLSTLAQLIEELVLEKAAADMGITVGADDIQAAEDAIRHDYPQQGFDRTMLENAISPQVWQKRLRARLLMAKVTARLPEATAEASPDEIAEASRRLVRSSDKDADARALLALIRQEKSEAAYERWLHNAKQQMAITIDSAVWKRVSAGALPPVTAADGWPATD